MSVEIETDGSVATVIISRPEVRNAVDRTTAAALAQAFRDFDSDDSARVAVLWGDGGNFCSGADLKAIGSGNGNRVAPDGDGPMGPTRMLLSKPVIAAVAGHAVAGGLELAVWCDLRVAEKDAIFGVYCRRWGVPLVDGGTVRLTRLIGLSRALDMILTGRGVGADEAAEMGLANRVVETGKAREAAESLAHDISEFPQLCMRNDRLSAHMQFNMDIEQALLNETRLGLETLSSGETLEGASRFISGEGRHGRF